MTPGNCAGLSSSGRGAYGLGFVATTLILHLVGIGLGQLQSLAHGAEMLRCRRAPDRRRCDRLAGLGDAPTVKVNDWFTGGATTGAWPISVPRGKGCAATGLEPVFPT